MEAEWRIRLFGGLRAERADQVVTHFRTQKTAELLAYLAYYRHRRHPREVLIELLWPEGDIDAGRHSLSTAFSSLRQQLEPPGIPDGTVLVADRYAVGLNEAVVTTDTAEFETALRAAAQAQSDAGRVRLLATAVELHAGELLPGTYAEWVLPEQQRLDELYFQALRQLILHHEQAGRFDLVIPLALRSLSANRLREEAHREVIRLYAATGRADAALRQYRELERLLREELDTTPSLATRALVQEIAASGLEGRLEIENCGLQIADCPGAAPISRHAPSTTAGAADPDQSAIINPQSSIFNLPSTGLEPVGGAVPLGSRFYVVRPTDEEFGAAIGRQDSIVLVKGARQVGKTSLLARGLQRAREAGTRVVLSHFQIFNGSHLESAESLLLALAETVAEQLDVDVLPGDVWEARRGPNLNFRRYLRREVLSRLEAPLVWGLDEIDRLFTCSFGSEIFALFRSWHDERALEPGGPWANLTLAIAYSTEAHLFITDLNQSPFNVGTRLALEDFTLEQVTDLNRRYGSPLKRSAEVTRCYRLLNGHPFLVRAGLHELATHGGSLAAFEARASSDDWIFGEHLRRIVTLLARDPDLREAVRAVLQGSPCPDRERFYRLRSAGVLAGGSAAEARLRCQLYARYLEQHLL